MINKPPDVSSEFIYVHPTSLELDRDSTMLRSIFQALFFGLKIYQDNVAEEYFDRESLGAIP